jgi:hypothetical protein
MHRQRHRGKHPDDDRLFGPAALAVLRRAADEVVWLLGREYPIETAVRVVADHHQLEARQRMALLRTCSSPAKAASRLTRSMEPGQIARNTLHVDGFNLIVTLETALGGGLTMRCRDGCMRDLAGLRGSYRMVDETPAVIRLILDSLAALGNRASVVYLESAVSNSGRLRSALDSIARELSPDSNIEIELVRDADPILAKAEGVVSADAMILDRCRSWFNLAAWIVDTSVPDAWCVAL